MLAKLNVSNALKLACQSLNLWGFLKGNVMKYTWRYDKKNYLEDLRKAEVYLKWMIEESTVKIKKQGL
jgi:hypothetical protein